MRRMSNTFIELEGKIMTGTEHTIATKKITACGSSLVINVTKECRFLRIEHGDYVRIIIETIPQETDNQ